MKSLVKILAISGLLFFSFIWGVFADAQDDYEITVAAYNNAVETWESPEVIAEAKKEMKEAQEALCAESGTCILYPSFKIKTNNILFEAGNQFKSGNSEQTLNLTLSSIMQKMMIALGSVALMIMVVWAGYIILHRGQDEFLSKWKTIFMAGVISLVVALWSYYLVNLLRYVLYN